MGNFGSRDSPNRQGLSEGNRDDVRSMDTTTPAMARSPQSSRLWALPLLLCGGLIHAFARIGSYLGLYGNAVQDVLVTIGLVLVFSAALYALYQSFGRPIVRRLALWGAVCGLIHLALNAGDGTPLLMHYWLFNDNNIIHVVAQELFSSAAYALLAGSFFFSMVSYQTSEETLALERDRLKDEIIERKRTEESLREREETFRALAENSFDTIMRFDRECRHLYVNPVVERLTGIPPAAFFGKTHRELGFPEELCSLWEDAIRQVFETKQPNRIEFQLPSGIWIDWLLVPELDTSGDTTAVLASARDITEIKRAEEHRHDLEAQLSQAQKMESVGRLAGGVAHDFNNLLTVILGYAEIALADSKALSPMAQGQIQLIHKAGERARDLTRQLLAFGRKQTLQMTDVDLNVVVVGFGKMLRRLIGEDIQVQNLLDPRIGIVKADPAQIEQVFLNLALNARDAMPNGGRLTVETADVVLDDAYAAVHPDVEPGDYVMLAVSDTGCGMSPETQKMVFEPFFTTKDPGKGTGLGLATVYGIVKQHRGHISVYSELGRGTTFKVYLPRVVQSGQEEAAAAAAAPPVGGTETILLVEDDAAVRQLTCGILADLGYDMIEAQSGRDAVRLAAERETIHLLLTDVIMPEMSGREVFTQVAAVHPAIKVLYMSGYTADIIAHHGVLDEGVHLLQKPFTRRSLAQKIREVLAG